MMTEKLPVVGQQIIVEREAVFLAGDDPNPETNPNIIIDEDSVDQDSFEERAQKSEYNEVLAVVSNVGREVVVAAQFAETDEQYTALADGYVRSVAFISEELTPTQQSNVAERAIEALHEVPSTEIAKKLIDENKAIAQIATQRSKELQAIRDDVDIVEALLRSERVKLLIKSREVSEYSAEYELLLESIASLDAILEREKPTPAVSNLAPVATPTTDELEAQFNAPASPESTSPGRGIQLGKLAKTVVHTTVEFAHKVKNTIILDESELDTDTKVLEIVK